MKLQQIKGIKGAYKLAEAKIKGYNQVHDTANKIVSNLAKSNQSYHYRKLVDEETRVKEHAKAKNMIIKDPVHGPKKAKEYLKKMGKNYNW